MAENTEKTTSVSFAISPTQNTPSGFHLRRFCNQLCSRIFNQSLNQAPCRQQIRKGDAQEDEFQYPSTQCLSSYYSVFVARLAIMVMLAILIGMLTILTWHFTTVYTTKSINSLAYELRFELLQRPILRMWHILNSTTEITNTQVKLCEYVMRRYDKTVTQSQQLEMYEVMRDITWALFASRKALSAITISYRNGFVQAFHRDHRSNNTFYIYSELVNSSIPGTHEHNALSTDHGWNDPSANGNVSAIWYREPLDPVSGEIIGKSRPIPPDDLIYIAGLSEVPDGIASWHVTVSKFTDSDSPLLSAALPVWDSSNQRILAVVGVTTALYSVGQLMRSLVEFRTGYMYLTSQEGYLLATSTDAPLLRNSTRGPELMMAADSEDHIIRLGAEWLQSTYGNKFSPNQEIHVENVKLGHEKYYINSFFLKLKRLPMVGVIIIPRRYIMGKVDERAYKTLVTLISASVCILVVGCLCILILTNGVSKEMKLRAELISHLDARRRAEASSNYKSQFLANMSHELRTPMAAVIGLLDILICDDCLTNEQFATVTLIRKCSNALLGLLNNILDLSKVESGKLILEEAEFDLGRELEGLVDMFSVQRINHNVETVLDLSDDMPNVVQGDSARVVQIFTNLISNSIKFTSSGHIILRGWCERPNTFSDTMKLPLDKKEPSSALKMKLKQHGNHEMQTSKKDNSIVLWFEVDDTGCGIDPSKWESVFESFEQADPSTTRTYGGTGLGLCIVRTLVNKMGGEIKVIKKDGPGTLMQLYLVLGTHVDVIQQCPIQFSKHGLMVLLALSGNMGRVIMSQWLRKNQVCTWEASEWNELAQTIREVFQASSTTPRSGFMTECLTSETLSYKELKTHHVNTCSIVIVVDVGILDLSTDIWKEQIKFLDKYHGKAKFAWVLNHDTSNAIKMELQRKGHLLMVNKPLYKAKMVHILEAVIKERDLELKQDSPNASIAPQGNLHECVEIDPIHFDVASSDDSDTLETRSFNSRRGVLHIEQTPVEEIMTQGHNTVNNRISEFSQDYYKHKNMEYPCQIWQTSHDTESSTCTSIHNRKAQVLPELEVENSRWNEQNHRDSTKAVNWQESLKGLCILLAEDTPVLQRVATIMLQKMGASVVAVGDGRQAVDALKCMLDAEKYRSSESPFCNGKTKLQTQLQECPPFDLILMDCQMPKMDGYEATKAIRNYELGTGSHIPIVALTAHAMSSDEAKCLEVGMDAYLTKPIDCKLMISTILSLTKRMA